MNEEERTQKLAIYMKLVAQHLERELSPAEQTLAVRCYDIHWHSLDTAEWIRDHPLDKKASA